jgi:hypothetical protein
MRSLRIAFTDFHRGFNPRDNRIWRALSGRFELSLVTPDEVSDLLVYSDFGRDHWRYQGLKVYLTGENMRPDFNECDLAFTPFELADDPRAVRLPYYAQALRNPERLLRPAGFDPSAEVDRPGFCAFVVSNPKSPERNAFFRLLNRRRHVDSGGRHFNNMGGPVADKMAFIRRYRFCVAFENTSSPGYTTEKLIEPLLAGSIPLYWGDPEVARDFDPGCMVDLAAFPDFTAAADHVLELDADRDRRLRLLRSPVFRDNLLPPCLSDEHISGPIECMLATATPGRRAYRKRRLREHVYGSWLHQTRVSIGCRLESLLWKLGLRN